jgi:hypothetical protein
MNALALRVGIVLGAALLLWRVAHVNLVVYDPAGRPTLPAAATASLDSAADDRALLTGMLRENPAQVEALLLLARERERAGDANQARRAYQAAFQVAPMDRMVLGAAAEFFLRQGADAQSLAMLDRLVDSYPETRKAAFPVLAQMLSERREPAGWNAIAARRPAWIGPFIVSSCERGVDPAVLVRLFLDRVAARSATAAETGCLVDRLRDGDRWREAYQVWLNTLPQERLADVGFVFNGGFEHTPSGIGFDWRPTLSRERDSGHTVEMLQGAGATGKRALRVSYNGKRQAGIPIAQYLALAPGRYEMSGLARPQSITVGRGVQWTLRCVRGGRAEAPMAASERFVGSSEWRRFAFEVIVAPDCPGQVLQLEPVGEGSVYLAGSAWFDELVLRRNA